MFFTWKVTLPAFTLAVELLIHMSPMVTWTAPLIAPAAGAAVAAVSRERFLATPMVVRDPSSNARWTVDGVLTKQDLHTAEPLVEAATPRAAITEARARQAPFLLSRHIIAQTDFVPIDIDGLEFPRSYGSGCARSRTADCGLRRFGLFRSLQSAVRSPYRR